MSTTLSDEQVLSLVRTALKEVAPGRTEEISNISLEVRVSDLSIDSVETMEMIGVLEEELGVIFAEEELAQVVEFRDLAEVMRRAVP
jgi:acyl carrier protein